MLEQEITKVDGQPFSLSKLRQQFIEWHTNPQKFVDFNNGEVYGQDRMLFPIKPLGEVTGSKFLGSGAFGRVWGLPNGKVLKSFIKDKGYQIFLDFIRKNPGNPHLPRVYYRGHWAGRNVVLMEKLEPTENLGYETKNMLGSEVRSMGRENYQVKPWLNPVMFTEQLTETVQQLYEIYRTTPSLTLDLHDANMMMRGETIVITDPFASGGSRS